MVRKKDILEIKRRIKAGRENSSIMRLTGCYVNGRQEKAVTFSEFFQNLEDEEFYKYQEIAAKLFSGNMDNNILELEFPKEEETGGMQQFFMGLRESELKNDELLDRFYDRIIENFDRQGNYLILLYYDVYDVPLKTTDGMKLDDSEEMFPYFLVAICPVELSKPGLGYIENDNRIGARIRDWIVEMPMVGFMFPSFSERSADIHTLTYYVKDPKNSHRTFADNALGVGSKDTKTEQKNKVLNIIKESVAPREGDANNKELILSIQQDLMDRIPVTLDDFGEEVPDDSVALTGDVLLEVLKENEVDGSDCDRIMERFDEAFTEEEIPAISTVIDVKKLEAETKKREAAKLRLENSRLENENEELTAELVNKTFEAVADAAAPLDAESGFSQTYDVILRVKPQKVDQITAKDIDGRRCVIIPIEEDEYINLNGINTKL